eukprot:jgi/Botrbrau1/16151/Bobra.0309s0001.1
MARQLETKPVQGSVGPQGPTEEAVKASIAGTAFNRQDVKPGRSCGGGPTMSPLPGCMLQANKAGDGRRGVLDASDILVDMRNASQNDHHQTRSLPGDGCEGVGTSGPNPQDSGSGRQSADGDCSSRRKRPTSGSDCGGDEGSSLCTDSSAGGQQQTPVKKQRMVWTVELDGRFCDAVSKLGVKNALPKSILQIMNVEGLTREQVASRLQKYRLNLKRYAEYTGNDPEDLHLQNRYNQEKSIRENLGLFRSVIPPPPALNLQLAPPLPLLPNSSVVWGFPVHGIFPGPDNSYIGFPTMLPGVGGSHQAYKSPGHPALPQDQRLFDGFSYPMQPPWAFLPKLEQCTNPRHGLSGDCSTDTCADTSVSQQALDTGKAPAQEAEEGIPSIDDTETHSPRKDGS